MSLNLEDLIPGQNTFLWKDALWLQRWQICCYPDKAHYDNIIKTASKLEAIGTILKIKINVTSWYRPPVYNRLIGGALSSAHAEGLACDFNDKDQKITADTIRAMLIGELDNLNIRMEDLPVGSGWCHVDLRAPSPRGRFFRP